MDNNIINKKKDKASPQLVKSSSAKLGRPNLSVPPFRQGARKKKLGDTIPITRWHSLHTHPEILLREVLDFLRLTNREIADTLDRLYVAETVLQTIVHAINSVFNKYLHEENFPESETQRNYLSSAVEVIQQTGIAYKHIFKQEYESFDSPMNLVQNRVRHAGFRILELVQIEQRLLGSSNQKLPDASWKDINQVFFVYWFFNNYSQQRELSGCLKPKSIKEKIYFMGDHPKSPLQLYLAIQLFGLVDGNSLPNKIQHILDAYLSVLEYKIPISDYNEAGLIEGQLIVSHNQSKPLQFKAQNITLPALQIDIFDLWRIVKKDSDAQHRINSGLAENISPALATLSETDRTPFVETIIKQLRYYSRRDSREHVSNSLPLRIFVGFDNCHKAMQHGSGNENNPSKKISELLQVLSDNSSGIADDDKPPGDGRWYLMDESEGGLRIRTQTSKFTTKVSIGQIIAFNSIRDSLEKKSNGLRLGFISRIHRITENEIDISVVKLGNSARSIVIQDNQRDNKDAAMIGFLFLLNDSYSQLMLPNTWKIKPHQRLRIHQNKGKKEIFIKKIALQQREFTTYDITLV